VNKWRIRIIATAVAGALVAPGVATRARADGGAGTVAVAAVTAGLTALATYLVKDYFDARGESKELGRKTEDILEEIKRVDTRAGALERENDALRDKTAAAEGVAEFWTVLIREDEEFFKPKGIIERVAGYEKGLETLYVKEPDLVEKVHQALTRPAGDWERGVVIRAYGAGVPGADFWELKKRLDQGLEGGVVKVAGEREPRYVSGAENLMAVLEYVRKVAGEVQYRLTLQRLWACTPEEVDRVLSYFPGY